MTDTIFDNFYSKFDNLTKKPEKIISSSENLIDNLKQLIKESYDFTKKEENLSTLNTLPQLIIENFDTEQIWQQIELQNENVLTDNLQSVSRLVAVKNRLWFLDVNDEDNNKDNNKNNCEESDEAEIENESSDNEEFDDREHTQEEMVSNLQKKEKSSGKQKSIVDDEFFKLNEMEEFLKQEEKSQNKDIGDDNESDEESVDLFDPKNYKDNVDYNEDNEESGNEINPKYDDFFNQSEEKHDKKRRKVRFLEENSEENELEELDKRTKKKYKIDILDDEQCQDKQNKDNNKMKSSLELREERVKEKIKELEELALKEKPWQLKGEITADKRPQNSLLEEFVDFDVTTRPPPEITEETTLRLEDIIKQRIKDKAWDDVERKIKLIETPYEYKKKLLLDQEKSKKSLAQIYEDEFLQQQQQLTTTEEQVPEEEYKEIRSMLKNLFSKLDALSNFHFTPKTVQPELRVVNNLPAIQMEEVAPVAMSDATLLAPEEIHKASKKGLEMAPEERTKTDKNRQRRKKKLKQKIHSLAKAKQTPSNPLKSLVKHRNIQQMKETSNKSLKSSTAFFNELQDQVKSQIQSKTNKKTTKTAQISAKKLKF